LRKRVTPYVKTQLSHLLGPKLNRYPLCAKYGWAFSSDMPDRYIKRKGIIFNEVAEKGDIDQTTKLQRENRILKDEMEKLQQDYGKVRKALEFLMPILESIDSEEIKIKVIEKRRQEVIKEFKYEPAELQTQEGINQIVIRDFSISY